MKDRTTPLALGMTLIRLHLQGWVSVPGYTCTVRDGTGEIYIAMQLTRSDV